MVGARASGTEQISQRVSYFCRSWPGGLGGRARALIPVREGLAWREKAGWVPICGRGVREAGQGLGKGFGFGGE